jgi:hypothetical protein
MTSRSARFQQRDASHQFLQPTCCHWHPQDLPALERLALAVVDFCFLLCAFDSEPSHGGRHRAFHSSAGSPQAATQLRARTRLEPCSWLRPFPLSPEGCSAFPSVTPADLLSPARAEGTWPLTLPVAHFRSPEQHRVHRREPEPFPPATRQRSRLSKLETPSSDRSLPPHPSPKLGMWLSGCHWYLRFAASAQLPTCVHARLSRARPTLLPAVTPEERRPHAAHRILQSKGSSSTPRSVPNPTSFANEQAHPWSVAPPLAGSHQLSLRRPGVAR